MANLITYFTKNEALSLKESVEIYEFSGDPTDFVQDCVQRFREAYISEEKIQKILAGSRSKSRKDIIYARLPQKTMNIAGDFGEILCYYLWTEVWASDSNIRPMKIRWKEHPDMPSHYADVILLKRVDENAASVDDKMYTIESKVWTSKMDAHHSSLTDALKGAKQDSTERAAKTIPYLVLQYQRDDEYYLAEQVERFGDPVNNPFQKFHYAVAIVESSQRNEHLSNFDRKLLAANSNIPVFLLPISDLRSIYQNLFKVLPNN